MANLVDKSGDATSNIVRQTSGTSLSFQMPGNVPLDVESVVATIDNTAGAATTATLVVRDSSGEVVATKRMGDTFPAGDTGTVTFSLRNADSSSGEIRFDKRNIGDWLYVETTGTRPPSANGMDIKSAHTLNIQTGSLFTVSAASAQEAADGNWQIQAGQSGSGNLLLQALGLVSVSGDNVDIDAGGSGDVNVITHRLGFFSVGPVVQQATPVTLADVIALLRAYGLAA